MIATLQFSSLSLGLCCATSPTALLPHISPQKGLGHTILLYQLPRPHSKAEPHLENCWSSGVVLELTIAIPSRVFLLDSERLPRTFQEMIYSSEGCLHQELSVLLRACASHEKPVTVCDLRGACLPEGRNCMYFFCTRSNAMLSHLSRICSPGLEMDMEVQETLKLTQV